MAKVVSREIKYSEVCHNKIHIVFMPCPASSEKIFANSIYYRKVAILSSMQSLINTQIKFLPKRASEQVAKLVKISSYTVQEKVRCRSGFDCIV